MISIVARQDLKMAQAVLWAVFFAVALLVTSCVCVEHGGLSPILISNYYVYYDGKIDAIYLPLWILVASRLGLGFYNYGNTI